MDDYIEKKRLAILKIINESSKPIGSHEITKILANMGYEISERTVRFDLLAMDKDGFTEYLYKKGRKLTEKGLEEIAKARVFEKIGFLSAKIDRMTYRMNFNLAKRLGSIVLNISIIEKSHLAKAAPLICKVIEAGYGMGNLLSLITGDNNNNNTYSIPENAVGIGTVCSITINGILLGQGIPTRSQFGGLLEIENNKPTRFVELINYDGTTLDPLEIFIKGGMTDHIQAIQTGTGLIGASFREMPSESRDQVLIIADQLKQAGLSGFLKIGYPEQPLCGVPVNIGSFGSIIIGGLNPIAILAESGIPVESKALSGLLDFNQLFHYSELENRIKQLS
ncbi:MAG: DUF128 domain-containing protein [Spirochaetales bacterium]|nr:DUF128 domain-containing protein [Spirochaetales bacterium]